MSKHDIDTKLFKRTVGKYENELSDEERQKLTKQYLKAGIYFFWILFAGMMLEGIVSIIGFIIDEPLTLRIPTFIWFFIFSGLLGYLKNINQLRK